MRAAKHSLVWTHAVLIFAAARSCLAATFYVPPDALPPRLDAGDVLNFGPGASTIGDPNESQLFTTLPNQGIRPGATINVLGGDFGGFDFRSAPQIRAGSVLTLMGGTLGGASELLGGVWNIRGGVVYGGWWMQGGTLNIEGGLVDRGAGVGGQINIRGGTLRAGPQPYMGTTLMPLQINVSGGAIVPFDVFPLSLSGRVDLNIRGGQVLSGLRLAPTATPVGPGLNLFVKSAALDGVALTGLVPGVPHKVLERDVTLSGLLGDGNAFSFQLHSTMQRFDPTLFPRSSAVNVILVPELPGRLSAKLLAPWAVFLVFACRRKCQPT